MRKVTLLGHPGEEFELICRSTKNSRVRSLTGAPSFLVPTADILVDVTLLAMIRAVKTHAQENYEDGWDLVIETYTDDEIAEVVKTATDPQVAIRMMARTIGIQNERRREIEATAW